MPHLAYGDTKAAAQIAAQNCRILRQIEADAIITDCATCGSTLKGYEAITPSAKDLTGKIYDVSEFLINKLEVKPGVKPVEAVVTYHDPCHLGRSQGIKTAPRELLAQIPGMQFKEMAEADRCCGGAGTFNIRHYEIAMKILERKISNILQVEPTILATGCPGCKMQLEHGLSLKKRNLPIMHPVEILAETY